MSKEKTTQELQVLNVRKVADKRLVDVVVVTDRLDSYRTIIHPNGCVHSLSVVPVDYLHNRIATGVKIVKEWLGEVEIELANGVVETANALLATLEIPETARLWTRSNRDKSSDEVASALENIDNGRLGWVSVDFSPVEVATIFDSLGNKLREEYPKWRMDFLSMLDTRAGQDESVMSNIRMKSPPETETTTEIKTKTMETKTVDIDANFKAILKQRAWVNCAVKRISDGVLGVVTKAESSKDNKGIEMSSNTIETVDGEILTVDSSKIGYDSEGEEYEWLYAELGDILTYFTSKGDKAPAENTDTTEAPAPEVTAPEAPATTRSADISELATKVAQLETENAKLTANYQRLLQSPEEKSKNTDSATDMGESAAIIKDDSNEDPISQKRMQILESQIDENEFLREF